MIKRIPLLLLLLFMATTFVNAQKMDSLSKQQQSIVKIAALTAKGRLPALATQLDAGLDAGLTINQIKEVIIHTYAYAGFPRSILGLQTFMTVLQDREAKGIIDPLGADASPIPHGASKYDRGKAVLDSLLGAPQNGPQTGYSAFAPTIEVFLKEHLFAAIFERDVLNYSERELATAAVLSSIGGVEPMLKSHLRICLNVGLSATQLEQFIAVIASVIGEVESFDVQRILDEVLNVSSIK